MPFVDGGGGEAVARGSEAVAVVVDEGGGEAGSCLKVISSSSLWTMVDACFFALLSLPFPAT